MLRPLQKQIIINATALCSGFLLLASLMVNSGGLWVNKQLADILPLNWNAETPKKEMQDMISRLDAALSKSPLDSYTYFLMADAQKTVGNDMTAEKYYRKAIRLNPAQATYLQDYAVFLDEKGERNIADSLMQAGIKHDLIDPDRKRKYATFLFEGNEDEKGLQVMTAVFLQDPGRAGKDIAFLIDAGFSDEDVRRILPERVVPFLDFAAYLEQKGDMDQAAALYRQALTYINDEKTVRTNYFYQVSRFFRKQKQYEEGLEVLLQAIKLFPADAELKVSAGNLYWQLGLTDKAIEVYKQALAIDQGNSEARENLENLLLSLNKKITL